MLYGEYNYIVLIIIYLGCACMSLEIIMFSYMPSKLLNSPLCYNSKIVYVRSVPPAAREVVGKLKYFWYKA